MNKPLCYVDMALHPKAWEVLSQYYELTTEHGKIPEAAAALVYGIPDEWIDKALRLKTVGCHSHSYKFGQYAAEKGIKITMADSLWRTVAEQTLALAMCAARNLPQADRDVRNGLWKNHVDLKVKYSGHDFQGRTFGILGMGQIGKPLADMLRGLRMQVVYNDIVRLSKEEEKELKVEYLPLNEMLPVCDYLAILIPLNESTADSFGTQEFSLLKHGCIFINTARAGIVNKAAFLNALEDGTICAAALDVLWDEGCPQPPELLKHDNIIMVPHLGGSTFECDMSLVLGITQT